jgi:hypothetical protein
MTGYQIKLLVVVHTVVQQSDTGFDQWLYGGAPGPALTRCIRRASLGPLVC